MASHADELRRADATIRIDLQPVLTNQPRVWDRLEALQHRLFALSQDLQQVSASLQSQSNELEHANAMIGAAFDYSNPEAHLFNNAGTTEANSYQLGLYGGWTDRHFFAQGLATIGHQDYRNTRPGVADTITSNPDGSTFVIAGTHKYARVGVFTVRVTITLAVADHAGASSTGAAQVRIRLKPRPLVRVRPARRPVKKSAGPVSRRAGLGR